MTTAIDGLTYIALKLAKDDALDPDNKHLENFLRAVVNAGPVSFPTAIACAAVLGYQPHTTRNALETLLEREYELDKHLRVVAASTEEPLIDGINRLRAIHQQISAAANIEELTKILDDLKPDLRSGKLWHSEWVEIDRHARERRGALLAAPTPTPEPASTEDHELTLEQVKGLDTALAQADAGLTRSWDEAGPELLTDALMKTSHTCDMGSGFRAWIPGFKALDATGNTRDSALTALRSMVFNYAREIQHHHQEPTLAGDHARDVVHRAMSTIFVVTVLRVEPAIDEPLEGSERPVGWFTSFEDAERVIRHNKEDIFEVGAGHYTHAVIEEIGPGVLPTLVAQHWYFLDAFYDDDEVDVEKCLRPNNTVRRPYGIGS